jgi:hydroxymethylglutaryl-CoA reductase (NADPH)
MSGDSPDRHFAAIPMQWVGPILLKGPEVEGECMVPLATYESPLWPSTGRGARVSVVSGGLQAVVVDERMTRSILLQAIDAVQATAIAKALPARLPDLQAVVAQTSRFANLDAVHTQIVGNLLFIRFEFTTGDAAGHNMVTAAADRLIPWLLEQYPGLSYGSISGNYCTDKKPSAVNGILGRGKYVVVEALVTERICRKYLKAAPAAIVDLNWKKNWIGTSLAGGIRAANAHFANMLLGVYLATGQDAANIVEGSQGFTHAEVRDGDLYFSVTLPNVIVGTVGSGKGLAFVQANLERMGCLTARQPGANARRLAVLAAATVWCGELSLLAAQTNPGELMDAHLKMERS